MLSKRNRWAMMIFLLSVWLGQASLPAVQPEADQDKVFLGILRDAYRASCGDIESLRHYYISNAEIISDGRQLTVNDIIRELKQSMASLTGLACRYEPKLRVSRVTDQLAYIVIRETIKLSAHEMGEREIQQICTYVFVKEESTWKIAHDHCSSVLGLDV